MMNEATSVIVIRRIDHMHIVIPTLEQQQQKVTDAETELRSQIADIAQIANDALDIKAELGPTEESTIEFAMLRTISWPAKES